MKKARLTEEQIIGILQEHEAGAKCADLCRKHGMSEGTFYAWKAKYSGMTVSEAKRLKGSEWVSNRRGVWPANKIICVCLFRSSNCGCPTGRRGPF